MPRDSKGGFHMNTQRAMAAERAPAPKAMASTTPGPAEHEGAGRSPIHDHLEAMHAEQGGKHMHVHHDGYSYQSHHVGEDGHAEGPNDHENLDALKQHMGQFFDEEGNEGSDWGGDSHKERY